LRETSPFSQTGREVPLPPSEKYFFPTGMFFLLVWTKMLTSKTDPPFPPLRTMSGVWLGPSRFTPPFGFVPLSSPFFSENAFPRLSPFPLKPRVHPTNPPPLLPPSSKGFDFGRTFFSHSYMSRMFPSRRGGSFFLFPPPVFLQKMRGTLLFFSPFL